MLVPYPYEWGHCDIFQSIVFFISLFIYFTIYLFIWLCQVLVMASRIFSCIMQTLSCGMQDIVPWPGMEPRSPALRAQSLSHWILRKVPRICFIQRPLKHFLINHFWFLSYDLCVFISLNNLNKLCELFSDCLVISSSKHLNSPLTGSVTLFHNGSFCVL